jgi:tricorn protease
MATFRASRLAHVAALAAVLAATSPLAAEPTGEPPETLLLQDPTVSARHVAFVYAEDLWIVERAGGEARRLTSGVGAESTPRLSPDGRLVAFTGEYDGNADVYVLPIEGGIPRRLTWHPDRDRVLGWHPDGRVCFASPRESGPGLDKACLVRPEGGPVEVLPLPEVTSLSFHADGKHVAYTPLRPAFRTWKRYRGGRLSPVWWTHIETLETQQAPHERASDAWPVVLGRTVWFASDRGGTMNVWRWKPGAETAEQVTRFQGFDVRNLSAGGGVLVLEQAGALHLLDPERGTTQRLTVRIRNDGLHALPRWQEVRGHVREGHVAPNGQRAVFEARGEILTLPRSDGDARNLTESPGAHDRDPAWSPDGKQIAWFTDAGGDTQLAVADAQGRSQARRFDLPGTGFAWDPQWSPDGKHVLFNDQTNRIAFLTLESTKVTEVARVAGSLGALRPFAAWSPDSKWIAFETRHPGTAYDGIALYSLADAEATTITDALGSAEAPVFSRDGKHLFFKATVDSGPRRFGLDMSASAARSSTSSLYVAVLEKDGKNPLAARSDEGAKADDAEKKENEKKDGEKPDGEKKNGEKKEGEGEKEGDDEPKPKPAAKPKDPPKTVIDLDDLDQRILALPLPAKDYGRLFAADDKLLFQEPADEGGPVLKAFSMKTRKAEEVTRGADDVDVSADGQSLLVKGRDGWHLMTSAGKDKKKLSVESVKVRVVPELEWRQTLREVWRLQRDFFYDPQMHGVDWPAMWERWQAFLPHVRHRSDLNLVIGELIGELACGHQYVSGGETPEAAPAPGTGLLGADLLLRGDAWTFTAIYDGQNWSPDLRAPLTGPGVDVKVGDVLVSVDGRETSSAANLLAYFEGTADRQVELGIRRPPEEAVRKVVVVPVASDRELRRRAWVEQRRKLVEKLSDGKLAYVYMPDTGPRGLAAFHRDFFSQVDREGLVLDERYNGGGKVADYVIDILSHEVHCWWMTRQGWVGRTPFATLQGPKVMLVNAYAGSGGDALPWMFQQQKLGTVVGTRTWGGLVGITGYPPLMDGGSVTAAAFGIMDPSGRWVVENEGVTPDVEVIEWPKDCAEGRDPQLEKAVAIALEVMPGTPRVKPPAYTPPAPR